MNSKRLIVLSLILFGSLWGLAELGVGELTLSAGAPRAALLTAIGVFFLILTRRMWHAPGGSFGLAAVASAYKFLQHPVWGCKIAAVLLVGAVFDVGFTLYERRRASVATVRRVSQAPSMLGPAVLAPVLTFASFVLFSYFARDVLHNPYWAIASKMNEYMFVQGPIAGVLSIPAALCAARIADSLMSSSMLWNDARWRAYRFAAMGSGIAGVAAAVALRY